MCEIESFFSVYNVRYDRIQSNGGTGRTLPFKVSNLLIGQMGLDCAIVYLDAGEFKF